MMWSWQVSVYQLHYAADIQMNSKKLIGEYKNE